MITNQKQTGPVWRIDAAGLVAALEEFSFGKRKMSETQVRAALALLNFARMQAGGNEEALKELE